MSNKVGRLILFMKWVSEAGERNYQLNALANQQESTLELCQTSRKVDIWAEE